MTREQKLALIVGFSLVLVVGVLISDHLSKARSTRLASVGTGLSERVAPEPPDLAPPMDLATTVALVPPIDTPRVAAPGEALTDPLGSPSPDIAPETMIETATAGGQRMILADGSRTAEPIADPAVTIEDSVRAAGGEVTGEGPVREITLGVQDPAAPRDSGVRSDANVRTHHVEEGDSLYAIAERYYGDSSLWRALREYNKDRVGTDSTIRLGVALRIPPKEVLTGSAPKPAPRPSAKPEQRVASLAPSKAGGSTVVKASQKAPPAGATKPAAAKSSKPGEKKPGGPTTYKVRKGDTLTQIAQATLGSSRRVQELIEANRDQIDDADDIRAGMILKVPSRTRG